MCVGSVNGERAKRAMNETGERLWIVCGSWETVAYFIHVVHLRYSVIVSRDLLLFVKGWT